MGGDERESNEIVSSMVYHAATQNEYRVSSVLQTSILNLSQFEGTKKLTVNIPGR